jgi:hypothetical protein
MIQDIKDFCVSTSDDLTKLSETPPASLWKILFNLSSPNILSPPDILSSPNILSLLADTPSRCSSCNHNNNKKSYVLLLPKRKKKPQDPNHLKKENLTFKQVWMIGRP